MTPARPGRRRRRALGAVLAGYLVAVALVLGWPTPVDAPINSALFAVLEWLHTRGMPARIGYGEIEFAANVALFVPVGLLLTLELRRGRWWVAALGGFGLSVLAEVAQGSLRPERFASVRDVVANTAGTVIGVVIAVVIAVVAARRRSRSGERRHPASSAA